MAHPEDPRGNRFLAALIDASGQYWVRHLERVDLKLGQVLHEPGRPQRHAYFPTSAVVSLVSELQSGASTEIAVVGNEGVVGISLFLGGDSTTSGGSVLIAGQGFRIGAQAIQDEFNRSGAVRQVVLIHCSRGHITVLDPVGLEQRSCECHAVVKKEAADGRCENRANAPQ